jgi:hypothetical protein
LADQPNLPINQPASGTYGEKSALQNLKTSFPIAQSSGPGGGAAPAQPEPLSTAPVAPVEQPMGRPKTGAAAPPGIPSAVLAPTDLPQVPVNTPLQSAPQGPLQPSTPEQGRLSMLYALANNQQVSEATRRWAQGLLDDFYLGQ